MLCLRSLSGFFVLVAIALTAPPASAQRIEEMSVSEARAAVERDELILVDVRTPEEWRETGIPDVAHSLDMRERQFVADVMALREQHPERKIGFICAAGVRSRAVASFLVKNGVEGVVDVTAGMLKPRRGWLASELPVRAPGEPVAKPGG